MGDYYALLLTVVGASAASYCALPASQLFHIPLKEAARKLNVCSTTLKSVCRKHGLSRWPYRTLTKARLLPSATNHIRDGDPRTMSGHWASCRAIFIERVRPLTCFHPSLQMMTTSQKRGEEPPDLSALPSHIFTKSAAVRLLRLCAHTRRTD